MGKLEHGAIMWVDPDILRNILVFQKIESWINLGFMVLKIYKLI